MIGGTIGALASQLSPIPAVLSAFAGFVLATVLLRIRNPRTAIARDNGGTRQSDAD
jgi:hypothetical protein